MEKDRILVISDLHITGGKNPTTRVWSPTEDFFLDREFTHFLEYFCDGIPTKLIINGDLFDFLQVLEFPGGKEDRRKKKSPPGAVRSIRCTWHDREFSYAIPEADIDPNGLRCTEEATAFLAGKIVEGHEDFFKGLVRFLDHGNEVIIIKGNHDVQLFWEKVREEIYARMEALCAPDIDPAIVRARLTFLPWFYHEPGFLWVEHGNQYEYTTSFVNFLIPALPFDYEGTSRHIELDLASFLVRYLTNKGETIDPQADNIRPLSRYWEMMWKSHPFLVLTTFGAAFTFVWKAFTKSYKVRSYRNGSKRNISRENYDAMVEQARLFGGSAGPDEAPPLLPHLLAFDDCKAEPTLSRGPLRFIWWLAKRPFFMLIWLLPFYAGTALISRFLSDQSGADPGWFTGMLSSIAQTLGILIIATLIILLRQYFRRINRGILWKRAMQREKKIKSESGGEPVPPVFQDDASLDLRLMARYIADRLNVRYVTFGHTHYTDIHALGNDRWYFNTGTWMTVFADREKLYRDARQLSFLKIERDGEKADADIHCWYPPRREPQHVVVVDLVNPNDDVEDSVVFDVIGRIRGKG